MLITLINNLISMSSYMDLDKIFQTFLTQTVLIVFFLLAVFIKIYDHRCKDDKTGRFGTHFFYEYFVQQTGETSSESESYDVDVDTDSSDVNLRRHAGVSRRSGYITNPKGTVNVVKTSKISSRQVQNGSASNPKKIVNNIATNIGHKTRRIKFRRAKALTNEGLGKAFSAVSNFALSLVNVTDYHNSIGHTKSAVRRSERQINMQNLMMNRLIESSLVILRPPP